jgi:hypothetical protein
MRNVDTRGTGARGVDLQRRVRRELLDLPAFHDERFVGDGAGGGGQPKARQRERHQHAM